MQNIEKLKYLILPTIFCCLRLCILYSPARVKIMQFTIQQEQEHFHGNALRNVRKLGQGILYKILRCKEEEYVEVPIKHGNPQDAAVLLKSAISYQQNQSFREKYNPKKGETRSPKLGPKNYAVEVKGCEPTDVAKCVTCKGKEVIVQQPGINYLVAFVKENREHLQDILGNDIY